MMKQMQQSVCALAVLAATTLPAMAASTVDVRVIGTITPAACTPTLSGGGTVDYGAINPTTLSPADYTVLPEKTLDFSVTCDAPAKIALKVINGRPGSLAGSTENISGAGPAPAGVQLFSVANTAAVGLGKDGSANIGGYGLRFVPGTVQADSVNVDPLRTSDPTLASWGAGAASGSILYNGPVLHNTWAATGTMTPVAFETLTAKFGVQAYLNHASELDLTKPVALDGLSTIELVYL
ncbi:DUF1120 domain-containing protein [Serratia rubidaea]|uniref:Protein of uncharacterized function (DUF1120) n=1 Tax=Serratia rubidaea TaxID=61652 RepID=A0A3S5F1P0_SERRU|nr:DUF1120 domain-containing protein [Serratia rubidaea]VEI65425.1 Protein of uncharacterised function (DUF1120) [Serratia rubidaea]